MCFLGPYLPTTCFCLLIFVCLSSLFLRCLCCLVRHSHQDNKAFLASLKVACLSVSFTVTKLFAPEVPRAQGTVCRFMCTLSTILLIHDFMSCMAAQHRPTHVRPTRQVYFDRLVHIRGCLSALLGCWGWFPCAFLDMNFCAALLHLSLCYPPKLIEGSLMTLALPDVLRFPMVIHTCCCCPSYVFVLEVS